MRIALIADTYLPLRTSGAVQLRDLSREFVRQGHMLTVLLPSSDQRDPWVLEKIDNVQLLRLKAPRTKDVNYLRRVLAEFFMPFAMIYQLRKSQLATEQWDGVVWYSPSIFHGPLVKALKKRSCCKAYLIIRDIFPEWAVDMGLMGRGLPYRFLNAVARYQYSVADVIGVQTPGNLSYFDRWRQQPGRKLEVLQNWLDEVTFKRCAIRICESPLAGRKIFVYAGNMGVAQGVSILIKLAERLRTRKDLGFLFVGRGSDVENLKILAKYKKLDNVLFYDEIHPDQIPDLYTQCSAGILALDPRHKSHNIPGKFLTYMQSGLPVLASINAGNDLAKIIRDEKIGQVCESNQVEDLAQCASNLLEQIEVDDQLSSRCCNFFKREFTAENAVRQIVSAIST